MKGLCRNHNQGFTLIELIVVVTVFTIAMTAAMSAFIPMLERAKQQGKIAEMELERGLGLDLLRIDLEQAGAGLAWSIGPPKQIPPIVWNYAEAAGSSYNDGTPLPPPVTGTWPVIPQAPRAVLAGNDVGVGPLTGINRSDYLVIKSIPVRTSTEANAWTYITNEDGVIRTQDWEAALGAEHWDEAMDPATQVIAIQPAFGANTDNEIMLITDAAGNWHGPFANRLAQFSPPESQTTYILYGVGNDPVLRMPFNRAEYYIATDNVPARCAPGTGVLVKRVLSHANGTLLPGMPLLDCVLDFQVVFGWDMGPQTGKDPFDGIIGTYSNADGSLVTDSLFQAEGAAALDIQNAMGTARELRQHLREIRVYVLAHEGQSDRYFDFRTPTINVGEQDPPLDILGHPAFNLPGAVPDWSTYRWRVFTLVVKPENVRVQKNGAL